MTGEGFVDGVVHDFVDEVVQTARSGGSDVHSGTLANGLESFEDLDIICAVAVLRLDLWVN